jgi:hypothetical protein
MQEEQATDKRPWVKPILLALLVENTEIGNGTVGDFGCGS